MGNIGTARDLLPASAFPRQGPTFQSKIENRESRIHVDWASCQDWRIPSCLGLRIVMERVKLRG
jgi:hypothetical protein